MEAQNIELHRVAVTAIIHKDGKFLILKRSLEKRAFPGLWTVPGGGLETSDYINTPPFPEKNMWYHALSNTLRREVFEETGLEMGEISYLEDIIFIRPDNIPVLTLSFYAPFKSGQVRLNNENVEYKWVSVEKLQDYQFIAGIPSEIKKVSELIKQDK